MHPARTALDDTFPKRVAIAIHDKRLQAALDHASGGFVAKRAAQVADLPEFEALRERARAVKDHVLAHLDGYLERFEAEVQRRGGHVHWAATAEEARQIVLDICKSVNGGKGARTITKGKSMVSEEIGLNDALEAAGYQVKETDLGEYIIQLANEPPSHIIVPAVHKTRQQVADLFDEHHRPLGYTRHLTEVSEMVDEARQVLREHYFAADVGITGGNFLVAETGSSIIVTNEGNGDLTQTLARVHIVTSGIERVVPTLDDAVTFLRLLARSATGQETETYTTLSTGPRRPDDLDGPEDYHVVLVDNGRSKMLGGAFREMLRCIRCGACLNHCPVYTSIGGHAYGWVYPGPMGSVLTPLINGISTAYDLPNACTLNGRCQTVCPVKIPLPGLLREIRRQQFATGLTPAHIRLALQAWAWVARRPRLYQALTGLAMPLMRRLAGPSGVLRSLPLAGGWTGTRDLPAPQGSTFQQAWHARQGAAR